MLKLSPAKKEALKRLSTKEGIIDALAIDQRGSLKKMIAADVDGNPEEAIVDFKVAVSQELTPFASSILLDPEYGLPAAEARDKDAGLLLAYEKTGYDASTPGRLPDVLEDWSVRRLKEKGADAIKFLLYYDIDEEAHVNHLKHVFVERLGSECVAEDMLFFLELVSYDAKNADTNSPEYAKVKPHKVNDMMGEFSKPQYHVDVLKMEVPVNMKYVEGFAEGEVVYSKAEAAQYFKAQSDATELPFIFLSAGVTAELFQQTLQFAKDAGSKFNGVLCGRATWKNGVKPFAADGEEKGREWLRGEGKSNIDELNKVLFETATPWTERIAD